MRRSALTLLSLLAIVVAGCSGGGSPTPTGTAPAAASGGGAASVPASPAGSGEASEAAASDAAGACAESTDTATVDVTIAAFAFSPGTAEASVGDVVGWTNEDEAPHSAVLDEEDCETDALQSGESGAIVFNEPGTYTYHCGIHEEMTATVEVN